MPTPSPSLDAIIPCPPVIAQKVRQFEEHLETYTRGDYSEAQLRVDFINPLLECLGWDVNNHKGYAEAYREVVYEDAIKVGGTSKAPDYGFYIGGRAAGGGRKFFLEAKKPAVAIRVDPAPAFQLRRYAYSAQLPLSILTNFKDFTVYDTRYKPSAKDSATAAAILQVKYTEYAQRWHEIASVFSRDAILRGAFDKYAQGKRRKGMEPLGDAFLEDIEGWRKLLAKDIAANNPALSVEDLNFAVQRTIDRILFLRICEDRGIETPGNLMQLLNGDHVYQRLGQIFRNADDRYNSGIFYFPAGLHRKPDPDRAEPPDGLTLDLDISDKAIQHIIRGLYDSGKLFTSYAFAVIPPDILGHVYEQFLGKVITLSRSGGVKIEEKPEVRKAGGVYYTPTYIVDYIVKNTVGKLLEGKTPKDAEKIRILDPASGSGSFLIGAYQYLLNWHLDWYHQNDPDEHCKGRNPPLTRTISPSLEGGGRGVGETRNGKNAGPYDYRLSTQKRKEILLNCIYGVDIDPQAVEVTKLSLLLKVLEGESRDSLSAQMKFFHQRALPDLGRNIKCGNSLIGDDFDDSELSEPERRKINKFNWQREFPTIMKAGGFDAVIGNPPYRRERDYKALMDQIAATPWGKKYRSPRMDLWYYFVHRGIDLLDASGLLSFIVNAYWTASTGSEKLIEQLRTDVHLEEVFSLGKLKVFEGVSGQHMVMRVARDKSATTTHIRIPIVASEVSAEPFFRQVAPISECHKSAQAVFRNGKVDLVADTEGILSRFDGYARLDSIGAVRQGIAENPASIGAKVNKRFKNRWKTGEGVFALRPQEVTALQLPDNEAALLRPYFDLCDVGRYRLANLPSLSLIYTTRQTCPNITDFPVLQKHLARFRPIMERRRETINGSNAWWQLHWPRDEAIWRSSKILAVQMADRPAFVSAYEPAYVSFSMNVFVPSAATKEQIGYLTGLLNSRLLWKWFQHSAKRRGGGIEINGNVLSAAPIRTIDFTNKSDKAAHDRMVKLVGRMLELHKKLAAAKSPVDKERLPREIEATDRQIDQLVYELYGLSEDEIRIVEEATAAGGGQHATH